MVDKEWWGGRVSEVGSAEVGWLFRPWHPSLKPSVRLSSSSKERERAGKSSDCRGDQEKRSQI